MLKIGKSTVYRYIFAQAKADPKQHPATAVKPSIVWEYDLTNFDYRAMCRVVVERVILRGWPDDFHAIFNLNGKDG